MLRALCWLDQARPCNLRMKPTKFEAQYARWPGQYVDAFSAKELLFCSSNKLAKTPAEIDLYIAGEQEAIDRTQSPVLDIGGYILLGGYGRPIGKNRLANASAANEYWTIFAALLCRHCRGDSERQFCEARMAQAREYNWCR